MTFGGQSGCGSASTRENKRERAVRRELAFEHRMAAARQAELGAQPSHGLDPARAASRRASGRIACASHGPTSGRSLSRGAVGNTAGSLRREEQHRREHRREPRQARVLGDDGRRIRDRVARRAGPRLRRRCAAARRSRASFGISSSLTMTSLPLTGSMTRSKSSRAFGAFGSIGGPGCRELDAFALDLGAIAEARRDDGSVPACFSASARPMYGKRSPCDPQHG